ncbi:monocarboxylate transporter 13-like isoform X1 [Apis florea]|uniref:monocarboxylate transporter 13-like isoform X1 n=1 Tax=Apis florea TaxID=7463 RepID=UPI00062957FA|nr:monocarboxylate transporter 13-like isoform X1 [Apis florea]XP_012341550.1 monocarboxylate transporter 13-like isoform X1 [Apis florea]
MTVKNAKTKLVPPDGGWGWVVLSSALIVNFLIPGTVKSFGVLFVEFLHVFKASSTAASWMPALCYFLYNSLGPLSSILSNKYSYKTVTIIGGAFAACGMMLSYFANSVSYLYVSYGLMVGIGAGLTFPPTVYIVTSYFEKLRGVANGLCISGSAIGTIVLPPFLQYLLDCFGYRGAVLVMGALTLNTLVCGLLYHPVEQHMIAIPIEGGIDNQGLTIDEPVLDKQKSTESTTIENETTYSNTASKKKENFQTENEINNPKINDLKDKNEDVTENKINETKKESIFDEDKLQLNKKQKSTGDHQNADSSRESNISEMNVTFCKLESENPELHNLPSNENKDKKIHERLKTKESEELSEKSTSRTSLSKVEVTGKRQFFDLSVLRDPIYLVILISNSTSAISNTNFMILLPSYAISQGFDKNSSALLLSIVSALDLVGRISGASLSDIDFMPKYYYFIGGLGTSGIALALLPMATSYAMLSFFCALFGLSSGMYIGITTVILADMIGTEKLSSSYGISLFVNGVLQLIGPPICGIVFETVGSYKPIFLAFGIILILGTALWAVVPLIKRNNKKTLQDV